MKLRSEGIKNGVIDEKYGKKGTEFFKGMATYSLPFEVTDYPEGTKCFALVLEDKDAVPVCGFSWIHWTAANIKTPYLKENASKTQTDFVQGTTSYSGKLGSLTREEASFYGGMAPPDKPHVYELHVFALSEELDLKPGFYMNELYKAMEGKVLVSATLPGTYNN